MLGRIITTSIKTKKEDQKLQVLLTLIPEISKNIDKLIANSHTPATVQRIIYAGGLV